MAEEFVQGSGLIGVNALSPAALGRDRVQIIRDSILNWKLEGRMFYAQQGNAGTKLAFAKTAYDEDQPQFALTAPAGAVLIPLALRITLEDMAGTENHIIWSTTTNNIGVGTSTLLTPVNSRRDALFSTPVGANSLYTGNATAATGLIEVRRWQFDYAQAAVSDTDQKHLSWTIDDPDMPILLGPATLQVHIYATGTAPQGYGEYTWISLDAASLGL